MSKHAFQLHLGRAGAAYHIKQKDNTVITDKDLQEAGAHN